jgi:hypothetical protein
LPNQSRTPPIRNRLLAALPCEEYGGLLPRLESVPLPFMEVLYEGGEPIRHVYFKKEMVRYTRGRVTVLDRDGLEASACECYGVVKGYGLRPGLRARPVGI